VDIKEIFRDPVNFCTYVLGFKPTRYQEDLAEKFMKHQFITARWCRQSGKSHMISALLLWYALTRPKSYICADSSEELHRRCRAFMASDKTNHPKDQQLPHEAPQKMASQAEENDR